MIRVSPGWSAARLHWSLSAGRRTFETTASYLLRYPECCRLANVDESDEYFSTLTSIDSITGISADMWSVLTDVAVWEWYRIRLPSAKQLFGKLCLPNDATFLFLLDQQRAKTLSVDINSRYLNKSVHESLFDAYGLEIVNSLERERTAMQFLARQSNHIDNNKEYLLILKQ